MLSYQHIYHAGNLADVHKHGLLSWALDYLTAKPKPVSYIETHAGRGLYDLQDPAALKTGEAQQGIARTSDFFSAGHPFVRSITDVRERFGADAYPGSPMLASQILRETDSLHVAELHPGEFAALKTALRGQSVRCHHQDGFELAHSLVPPSPRRGLMLIDPSYEIKTDYAEIPRHIAHICRAWNVGIICLWYPVLKSGAQTSMVGSLRSAHPDALCHEVRFAPAREGHGMIGSGFFVINPPWGLAAEAERLGKCFDRLSHTPKND